jgi:ribose transport system ATP-binding protein
MLLGREPTALNALGLAIVRRKELQKRAKHVLDEFGFQDIQPDDRIAALSIEKRQIVQIARVLALDAKVVVFDEPTARLSLEGRRRLFSVMDGLRQAGKMVVFVSHYLEEVLNTTDRIIVLRDGRVAGENGTRDMDIPGLTKLMLGGLQVGSRRSAVPPGALALVVKGLTAEPHFRHISFEASASEVLGLTGIAGSGRQQLVRSLIGESFASGSVTVAGAEIERTSVAKVVGRFLGFVPEDRKSDGILLERSVNDNLSLPWLRKLSILGIVDQSKVRPRVTALIERLGLVCSSGAQLAGQLSGGNQQKAVLGRWLGSGLPIVILESPTVGVDVAGKEEIRRLIRSLCEDGMAVLISTEDHWELEQLTDRILVMVRGEIIQELHTKTVSRADLVSYVSGNSLGFYREQNLALAVKFIEADEDEPNDLLET